MIIIHTQRNDTKNKKPATVIFGERRLEYREAYFYFIALCDLNFFTLIHYFHIKVS